MAMGISNNTGHVLTTAQIYVEWNHDGGHDSSNDRTLRLRQINLGTNAWNGDILAPSAYPIGESTIQFVFHQDYDTTDGTERIIITIGNPGCTNYPIDSSK